MALCNAAVSDFSLAKQRARQPAPVARFILTALTLFLVSACASTMDDRVRSGAGAVEVPGAVGDPNALYEPAPNPRWAGYGYIGQGGEPTNNSLVDVYETRRACEAGVSAWRSRQVAGTLVWGECLPIDRH